MSKEGLIIRVENKNERLTLRDRVKKNQEGNEQIEGSD